MNNLEIAQILSEIAEMLEMQGVQFKPRAYQNAARVIENLSEDVRDIYKRGELEELPGIGKGIGEKIVELLTTGRLKYYTELKKGLPMDVDALMRVPGMGPKRIKLLYDELNVRNLKDLEKAAQMHQIQTIKGLGPKVEEDILHGIAFAEKKTSRFLLGYIMPLAEGLKKSLQDLAFVQKVEIAGSYRRRKETIGDIDILAASARPQDVIAFFVKQKDVQDVLAQGSTKCSVRLHNGLQIDLRVVAEKEFGSALQYFTGNKEHNVELRKIALSKGYTLNEYGLFTLKGKKWVAGRGEEEIYRKLGVGFMVPEMRENRGELTGKLPQVLAYGSCHGDFQTHSTWSDGSASVEEMARAAAALGWKFITVTDHVGQVGIANPLSEKRLEQQWREIDKVQKKVDIRIFKGAEVDILKDGKLALSRAMQKKLDVVLASVHLATKMSAGEMTARICTALENNRVHILGHPTGRLLNEREGYSFDFGKVFEACRSTGTLLDIDCHPERMDLPDVHVKAAREMGCGFAISTDSHAAAELKHLQLGEAIARRGWLTASDVLNTYSVKEIEKRLGRK